VTWVLVHVMLMMDGTYSYPLGEYATMNECFDKREIFIEEKGRPIYNYQAVCVPNTMRNVSFLD
jgi:hypothetical protein